jgi:glycosyltransferase involved in cell wall biosynthesis
VIYVYHPPATVGVSAALISILRGIPFVYDIQDLWPDTLCATGMIKNRFLLKVIGRVCDWIYSKASHIVVLSPGFRERLICRGVDGDKVTVIYNWCDEVVLGLPKPTEVDLSFMDGYFNVVFAGNMGRAQSLSAVIEAASIVAELNEQVQFVFVGDGLEVNTLERLAQKLCLRNVRFIPQVPMSEVGSILARAQALLVHLKDDPLFPITIPSKTQAYLAIGKPIIMGVRGNAADLIRSAGAGLLCEPENPRSIAESVIDLSRMPLEVRAEMGKKGMEFYSKELSLDIGVSKFIRVFARVIEENRAARERMLSS